MSKEYSVKKSEISVLAMLAITCITGLILVGAYYLADGPLGMRDWLIAGSLLCWFGMQFVVIVLFYSIMGVLIKAWAEKVSK